MKKEKRQPWPKFVTLVKPNGKEYKMTESQAVFSIKRNGGHIKKE